MADFSEWGPQQSGENVAIQNIQKGKLNELAMQESVVNMENQKQLMGQRKQQMEQQALANQRQQMLQQQMQRIAMDQTIDTDSKRGEALSKSGFPEEGAALTEKAALALQHLAMADKEKSDMVIKQQDQKLDMLGKFSQVLPSIKTQDDYKKIVDSWQQTTGKSLPPEIVNAKWTPELKSSLESFVMTQKDKLIQSREDANSKSQIALRTVQGKLEGLRGITEEARAKYEEARAKNEEKNHGKAQPEFSPTDTKDVLNMIKRDFPKTEIGSRTTEGDPATLVEARYVSSQARELVIKNPALDKATALEQAYQTAKANGEISAGKGDPSIMDKLFGTKPGDSGKAKITNHPEWAAQEASNANAKNDPNRVLEIQDELQTLQNTKPESGKEALHQKTVDGLKRELASIGKAAPPMTAERWAKMQSGDTFIAPDGTLRKKP